MNEKKIDNDALEVDFWDLANQLLKKAWIIAIVVLLSAILTFLYSYFLIDKEYRAATKIFVMDKTEIAGTPSGEDLNIGNQIRGDVEQIVKSRYVLRQVIDKLDLDMTPEQLYRKVNVYTLGDTRFVEISVIVDDPQQACDIANTIRDFSAERMVEVMNIDAINIVDVAEVPRTYASPDIKGNTFKGAAIGFVICVIIIFLKYALDDAIYTSEDIKSRLGLSVLGTILYDGDPGTFNQKNWKRKMHIFSKGKKKNKK